MGIMDAGKLEVVEEVAARCGIDDRQKGVLVTCLNFLFLTSGVDENVSLAVVGKPRIAYYTLVSTLGERLALAVINAFGLVRPYLACLNAFSEKALHDLRNLDVEAIMVGEEGC